MTRTLRIGSAALSCTLALAQAARADDPPPPLVQAAPRSAVYGDHWGVVSAITDSPGHDVLSAEFGYPGVTFGYTHGSNSDMDWGVKFALDYGLLYTTTTQFGIMATLPLRFIVGHPNDKLDVMVHVDPGFFTYVGSDTRESLFGLIVPLGVSLGLKPVENVRLSLGMDLPMGIQFLHSADFIISPQWGFAVETYVQGNFSIGFHLMLGPVFVPTASSDSRLGLVAQATVGYRL